MKLENVQILFPDFSYGSYKI